MENKPLRTSNIKDIKAKVEAVALPSAEREKLADLPAIKSIGDNLNLDTNGTLSAVGGGGGASVVDSLGYSKTEGISQSAATSLLYPTTGDTDFKNMVTAGNDLGDYDETGIGMVVGTANTVKADSGKYRSALIFGYNNQNTGGEEGEVNIFGRNNVIAKSYDDIIFGTSNKVTSLSSNAWNQVIVGTNNTLNIPKSGLYASDIVVGNSNTLTGSGQIFIGTNSTTDSVEPDTIIGVSCRNNVDDSIVESNDPSINARQTVIIGQQCQGKGFGNVLIGNAAKTATPTDNTIKSVKMSVALGAHSATDRNYEVSVGGSYFNNPSRIPFTRYLANVKAGEKDTDAVNLKQMKDYVAANAGGVGAVTYTADDVKIGTTSLEPAKGTQEGMAGQAGIMSSFQATQLAALAQAYEAEEKGTVLYEGTASVNNIELSESGLSYDHLIVVAQYMGMGSFALEQQVSAVFYPTDSVKAFQMNATDITTGNNPMVQLVQDIWSITDDGMEIELAGAFKSTTNSDTTVEVETTSNFTITKVVGFGKKSVIQS